MAPPDGVSGARLAAQRQHAAGRVAARDRRGRRAAGVLPVPADHQPVAAAAGVVRRRRRRVDPATARPARRGQAGPRPTRDLARLHPHRRPHPERRVGRQADVEPDAAAAAARRGPAGPLRHRPAVGDPRRRRQSTRCWSTSTGPTWCRRRCRSGGPCRPGCGGAVPIRCATPAPSTTPAPSHTSSRCCGRRRRAGATGSPRRTSTPIDVSYPVLWRNLTEIVGTVLEALGLDPRLAPAPGAGTPGRPALRRMGGPLPRRRRDERGCRYDDSDRGRHPRRRAAAAGGRVGAHHPRGRRRVAAPGAAVLRRQGLDRAASLGGEGLSAVPAAVSGAARRHRPQLRRGHRVPRPPARRARPQADRRLGAGVHRQRPGRRSRRPARRATGSRPAPCSTRWRPAGSTPRSAVPAATRSAPAPRNAS